MTLLKRILLGTAVLLVAALAGLEVYTRVPAGFAVPALGAPPDATGLVILFHGSRGREEPTLIAVEQRFRQLAAQAPGTAVIRYIWSPWSDNLLRARAVGLHVGAELGREAARLGGLRYIHLVGHSAGAYPMDAFCRAYRAHCRKAMKPDSHLLIIETVIPPGDEPHQGKMQDIAMMVLSGGQERTQAEYARLLAQAGLRLTRVVPTASPVSVVEAVLA